MPDTVAGAVAAIRRFSRFYTRRIGVLDETHLGTPFTLAESRVLYELAEALESLTPTTVARRTGLDAGYLSRILQRFEKDGLMARVRSTQDGRSVDLNLTEQGRRAYDDLRFTTEGRLGTLVAALTPDQRRRLVSALAEAERLLSSPPPSG
jgi:DNA-binding MarR family transcriptional regulator